MLDRARTPTRLIDPSERPPVVVVEPARPSRFRPIRVVVQALAFAFRLTGLKLFGRLSDRDVGILLRTALENLGGLWIKAGHLLSLRIDIFPSTICEELARLEDRHFGFPTDLARRIIEEDLGGPVEKYFDEFADVPFAVASIAQVHRARLRHEQRYVAVKVQQPYVADVFARDLALIGRVVKLIALLRFRPHLRWDFALDELRDLTSQELNFHYEASAIRRMRKRLRRQKVYVPRVFSRYTTERVLVTEFIHAALMADVIKIQDRDPVRLDAWFTENNIDPRLLARRLIDSILRQILEHNLYHGDLAPSHIVLLRDSRVALIDFTMTTFTEREYLEKYRLFVKALAMRDYAKAADLCLMLCASLPSLDLEEVKEHLVRSLRMWATRTLVKELPYRAKSIDNATIEVVNVMSKYQCTMDWGWLRIRRALMTLDMSLERLYPEVNYTRVVQKYVDRAERRSLRSLIGPPLLRRSLGSYVTALDIQDRVNEYTMFQGALVRRHAQVFQAATNKVAAVAATMVAQLALAAVIVGMLSLGALLDQWYPAQIRPLIGPQLARLSDLAPRLDRTLGVVLLLVLGYVYVVLSSLRRRLRQKDFRSHERGAAL
ncbi:MAG TPA: AarF/UbiB family protein [Vicinamibacterales bacterium]|jgi:ubiquinone biosynthesis protein|nr:AarF/UbiB family protein [Vicinamibacterales bacterium]